MKVFPITSSIYQNRVCIIIIHLYLQSHSGHTQHYLQLTRHATTTTTDYHSGKQRSESPSRVPGSTTERSAAMLQSADCGATVVFI